MTSKPLKHKWWGGHRWGPWSLEEAMVNSGPRKTEATVDMRRCQVQTCRKTEVRYL